MIIGSIALIDYLDEFPSFFQVLKIVESRLVKLCHRLKRLKNETSKNVGSKAFQGRWNKFFIRKNRICQSHKEEKMG